MQKCVKGQEESAVRDWKAQHPSGREEAFFFTYDRLKRFEGDWHLLKLPLFPGLIFLECQARDSQKEVPAHAGPGFRGDASGFQD